MEIVIKRSTRPEKKYRAIIDDKKTIHFGQAGASDYTIHKDNERKENYIKRHQKREKSGIDGIETAGFYSRWLTWNLPSLKESARDIERKFNVNVKIDT